MSLDHTVGARSRTLLVYDGNFYVISPNMAFHDFSRGWKPCVVEVGTACRHWYSIVYAIKTSDTVLEHKGKIIYHPIG